MPPDYTALEHDITHVSGDDVLLNWRRVLGEQSDWTAQVYFDQTERHWTAATVTAKTRTRSTSISSIAFPWATATR